MMITATKVKAIHIPYPTPAPPHTHTGHVHLPSILHQPCGGYLPLGPTAPPQWRDAHSQRHREGPSSHTTPHRQTRLDSPPPPHKHRAISTSPQSYLIFSVDIRPSVQQHFHYGEMPFSRGHEKGRHPILHHIDRQGQILLHLLIHTQAIAQGIQVIQKVGVPVMKTMRNRSV